MRKNQFNLKLLAILAMFLGASAASAGTSCEALLEQMPDGQPAVVLGGISGAPFADSVEIIDARNDAVLGRYSLRINEELDRKEFVGLLYDERELLVARFRGLGDEIVCLADVEVRGGGSTEEHNPAGY